MSYAKDARLEIEERETTCQCQACGNGFIITDKYWFICPSCEDLRVEVLSGRELYIEHYQGEEIAAE